MTTIAIIVAVILTLLIFTLTIIALSSILKVETKEIELGNRDSQILKDSKHKHKKSSKILNIVSSIFNFSVILLLGATVTFGLVYKISDGQFNISNQVSLVIASDSMNGFYNESYEYTISTEKENAVNDQFKMGDIATFSTISENDDLVLYDVYGYKNTKGQIITHRYLGTTDNGKLVFRGDNAKAHDSYVNRSQVILHYTNSKLSYLGFIVLFSQSMYGLYAFLSCITVIIITDIYLNKYNKLIKNRRVFLEIESVDKPDKPSKKKPTKGKTKHAKK